MAEQNNLDKEVKEISIEIEHLKSRYNDTFKFFKIILSMITIVFLFVGVIITVLSISSKSEIENAINRMETRFEKLAGVALKESNLDFFINGNPVSNIINKIEKEDNNGYLFRDFYLKNVGNKTAKNIKLKFYFESELLDIVERTGPNSYRGGSWTSNISTIEEYPFLYEYGYEFHLRPNETWSLSSLFAQLDDNNETDSNSTCKLYVFYDSAPPRIITFILQ